MPPQYTAINLDEMKAYLENSGYTYHFTTDTLEHMFEKHIRHKNVVSGDTELYTLRVYTSVDKRTNVSRDVGQDAIRIVVLSDKGLHAGNGRVNRTQGWKSNLEKRLNDWKDLVKWCPQCGNPLRTRKGKYGMFYGCSTYPKCGYTEKMK